MSEFFNSSQEIANNFLQNIVFIDDKAFSQVVEKGNHDFDAYNISKAFAKKKKVCAIYKPKTSLDIEYLAELAKKADITIIDWQINLEEEPVPAGQEEQDEEVVDPRGPHTLRIIHEILSDSISGDASLKLILVYTGEIALQDIRDDIYNSLNNANIADLKKDFCEVSTPNIRILIIAKPDNETDEDGNLKSKFNHNPEYNARVKSYDQLPDFILDEFTKMTSGLLSNFVLESLTVLRNNTFRLIKLYNKGLDLPFLANSLLLPNQEDSKEQLSEIFADSVHALLNYNQGENSISSEDIKNWIDTQTFTKQMNVSGKNITLDNTFLKTWVDHDFIKAISDQWTQLNYGDITEDQIKTFNKKKEELFKNSQNILSDAEGIIKKDIEFSVLTHHKSVFKPTSLVPKLTLGAIIKGTKSGYWVCIQQRCDSVRIVNERRFLFLPLKELDDDSKEKFHFVTSDGKKLQLSKKSFNLRTIKFFPNNPHGVVKANDVNGKFIFEPWYKNGHPDHHDEKDEVYEWILDLKDLHAQRIANDFAGELSRVGLDESEWLRRRSN
ncbi:MAG: hypothetical protein HYX39_09910 [Bacteroidetes bacterium]|nr:hypothetical protein [Bacteroidota bacterium]